LPIGCSSANVIEPLDFVRGHFLRRHIIRRKYAPIGNPEASPIIAPLSILQGRCIAAPGLLAGTIGCDRYSAYNSYAVARNAAAYGPGFAIYLAFCLAHIRRGFVESTAEAPIRAGWIIRQMAHLYQIEETLRNNKSSPVLGQAARAVVAGPILRRLGKPFFCSSPVADTFPRADFVRPFSTPATPLAE
jgi:hypothetical protein